MIRPVDENKHSRHARPWGGRYGNIKSPFWLYCGSHACRYLFKEHIGLVDVVAKSLYYDFPYAADRKLNIGDSCPVAGSCSGHPGRSHGTLFSFDTNYYTLGPNNRTQYRLADENTVLLWIDGYAGVRLLPNVFDWERNFLFFWRLRQVFPDCNIHSNTVLVAKMVTEASKKYGNGFGTKFSEFVKGNSKTTYNHHMHAHINLNHEINWDLNTRDFL